MTNWLTDNFKILDASASKNIFNLSTYSQDQ